MKGVCVCVTHYLALCFAAQIWFTWIIVWLSSSLSSSSWVNSALYSGAEEQLLTINQAEQIQAAASVGTMETERSDTGCCVRRREVKRDEVKGNKDCSEWLKCWNFMTVLLGCWCSRLENIWCQIRISFAGIKSMGPIDNKSSTPVELSVWKTKSTIFLCYSHLYYDIIQPGLDVKVSII